MTEPKKKLSPTSAIAVLLIGGLLYGGNYLREKWFGETAPTTTEATDSSKGVAAADSTRDRKTVAAKSASKSSTASNNGTTAKPSARSVTTKTESATAKTTARKSVTEAAKRTAPAQQTSNTANTTSTKKPSRFSQERKRSRFEQNRVGRGAPSVTWGGIDDVARAFKQRRSDVFVEVRGKVVHVLPLDTQGSRHQNCLLELSNGITLKVSHNIDLAPMIPGLRKGMMLRIRGEYEYNEKGGVLHWTHHDPARRHPDGWIELDGKKYG